MIEIFLSVQTLTVGKTSGCDKPDLFNALNREVLCVNRVCKAVWCAWRIQKDWQTGRIIPIHVKGDRVESINYRGISILSLLGNLYANLPREKMTRNNWTNTKGYHANFVLAIKVQCKFSLTSKFSRNLGSMPKMATLVSSTSPRHTIGSLEKSFGECCGRTVLKAACYWQSCHYIPAQKFLCVLADLICNHSQWALDTEKGVCYHHSSYSIWIDSQSWVDEGVTFVSCRISCLIFSDDLVLLAFSDEGLQYAVCRLSAACDEAGKKSAI